MRTERINYAEEFATTVDKYMFAVKGNLTNIEALWAGRLSSIMGRETDLRETDLERVILFLLPLYGSTLRAGLMMHLLMHESTPVSVLTVASRGPNEAYRAYAAQNPNCLEEDRVYVALADTHKEMPWL